MFDFNYTWVDFICPKCGYQDQIQLIDVKTEKLIFCNNCKISIHLIDNEASVHRSIENINQAINGLVSTFKKLGK
jgi:Zn ribbon nucleic-acid-binding protein